MSKIRYYYPEDIIKKDGKAHVGYGSILQTDGFVAFSSELPVVFTEEELEEFDSLYFQIWERSRLRIRKKAFDEFLSKHYPKVQEERDLWDLYVKENEPSVTAFRMREEWE